MAIALAEKEGADIVIAHRSRLRPHGRGGAQSRRANWNCSPATRSARSWPAIACRSSSSSASSRRRTRSRCVIVKTLVTTDLQKAIAEKHGLRCVETLTGFKYIGEKLGKYEAALPADSARELPRRSPKPRPARCGSQHSQLLRLRRRGKLRLQRGTISSATRTATAPSSCSPKSPPTRNRAG